MTVLWLHVLLYCACWTIVELPVYALISDDIQGSGKDENTSSLIWEFFYLYKISGFHKLLLSGFPCWLSDVTVNGMYNIIDKGAQQSR